jgi:hypothetical protein
MAAVAANSGHHHHHHHHGVPVSVSDFEAAAAATLLPTTVSANGSNGGGGTFMLNNNVLSSYSSYGGGGYTPVDYPLPPIDARGPAADFADLGPAAPWPPCWGPGGVAEAYQATPPPPSAGFASQVEAELALGKNPSIDFLLEKRIITLHTVHWLVVTIYVFPDIYIFPESVWSTYSAAGKYVDRSWEYINRSQTHKCGNWDWSRAIPRK